MPIYEYRCRDCGHELEALQKMSDELLTTCPECGAEGLYKKVSAAGFRLKGAGWYETDFKKDGKRNLAGEAAAPVKTDTKPDAAPAAPSKSKPQADAGSKPSGKAAT